jgi:serine/threonine protein kinase
VLRSTAFKGRRAEDIKQFIAEIDILKRLKHHHIVEFVGSYTDHKYFGLIMSPVAEMDLRTYLTRATVAHYRELRTFFGCLARALEFLHANKVRHKDIKPANILVDRGNVLFADFGLSLDFTDASGSTTMSMVNGMTPRYCAPEVAQYEPRNTMSDIWSLGVVFMEMIVALKGRTVQFMDQFFSQHGSQQTYIRANLDALADFIAELGGIGEPISNQALGWTQQMLLVKHQSRPTASSLVASILTASQKGERISFCGVCCTPDEEDFSD